MRLPITAALMLAATPALAHHPLGGLPMQTFADGLLSGVGHPLLGFDHLFFVIAMGVAARFTARPLAAPAAYIAAMLGGCLMMSAGLTLPLIETVIIFSLLVTGGLVLSGRTLPSPALVTLFAGFGLFHGAAFATALTAQEAGAGAPVLMGYLVGLGALQYALALAAGWLVAKPLGARHAHSVNARLVGAMVAGVGLFLALERIEAPLVAALAG